MSFTSIRSRIEAILETVDFDSSIATVVSDSTPVEVLDQNGLYHIYAQLPDVREVNPGTGINRHIETQTWAVVVVAPEVSASQAIVKRAESHLLNLADAILDRFSTVKRLELNDKGIDRVHGIELGTSTFPPPSPYAGGEGARHRFVMPINIIYQRK